MFLTIEILQRVQKAQTRSHLESIRREIEQLLLTPEWRDQFDNAVDFRLQEIYPTIS